ncbi:MAG: aldose epimerase family protein [Salinivenus sp.]
MLAASIALSSQAQLSPPRDTTSLLKVHVLTNANGVELRTMNYGGTILGLRLPDRNGSFEDVVLGLSSPERYRSEAYASEAPYLGALIGRYCNRIEGGQFDLDGHTYQLTTNHGPHHLHGGETGFDQRLWTAHPFEDDGVGIRYSYASPEGEEGYPGRLTTTVTYRLRDDNALVVDYEAHTTAPTPVNLTQHTYFNLAGHDAADVLDHRLTIDADHFTPVDASLIPTGEIRPVAGTPFDFRRPTRIGARLDTDSRQLRYGNGYDHNFVLNETGADETVPALAARAFEPDSGRELTVYTTEPGVQLYTGNSLSGTLTGKNGATYDAHSGFCLETQHFPNSLNEPDFPSTILRPDETYRSTTIYAFDTRAATS